LQPETVIHSPESPQRELRSLLTAKHFECRRLSLGKAAEFYEMDKIQFMYETGHRGVPIINLDDDQIQDELSNEW